MKFAETEKIQFRLAKFPAGATLETEAFNTVRNPRRASNYLSARVAFFQPFGSSAFISGLLLDEEVLAKQKQCVGNFGEGKNNPQFSTMNSRNAKDLRKKTRRTPKMHQNKH